MEKGTIPSMRQQSKSVVISKKTAANIENLKTDINPNEKAKSSSSEEDKEKTKVEGKGEEEKVTEASTAAVTVAETAVE